MRFFNALGQRALLELILDLARVILTLVAVLPAVNMASTFPTGNDGQLI